MTTLPKVLVLLDGSDRARETLQYVTRVEPLREKIIVLYHVYSEIPEYYWDLDQDPQRPHNLPGFKAWQKEKREEIQVFMEEGRDFLIAAGFPREQVEINIHKRESGIARDILAEARNGYEAVVMRRRGMGHIKGVTLGSVSCKLLSKLPEVPVLLAGKRPPTDKVLIAVDGSPSSSRAVDLVAAMLGPHDYTAELFHVIRGVGTLNPTNPEFIPAELFELIREEVMRQIKKLKEQLIAAGFQPDKVSGKILSGAESRAEAIVREAENNHFGTIVVGRKGVSRIQDFFMGRVCHKVIHSGRDFTVWIA